MNKTLYTLSLSNFDLKTWLKQQKYWVFCSNNKENWNITDMNNPEIYKRVQIKDGYVEFVRLSKDPLYKGLRPRIEIRPIEFLLSKGVEYRINFVE